MVVTINFLTSFRPKKTVSISLTWEFPFRAFSIVMIGPLLPRRTDTPMPLSSSLVISLLQKHELFFLIFDLAANFAAPQCMYSSFARIFYHEMLDSSAIFRKVRWRMYKVISLHMIIVSQNCGRPGQGLSAIYVRSSLNLLHKLFVTFG